MIGGAGKIRSEYFPNNLGTLWIVTSPQLPLDFKFESSSLDKMQLLAFFTFLLSNLVSGETVWPLPKQISLSGAPYPVSTALSIKTSSKSNILEHGITRYLKYITTPLLTNNEKDFKIENDGELELVVVNVTNDNETLGMQTSYKYSLVFNSSNTIQIDAESPFGAL